MIKLLAIAVLLGLGMSSGSLWLLSLGLLFPAVWVATDRRWIGGISAVLYHGCASWGVPVGAMTYFGHGFLHGAVLWVLALLVSALPYFVFWHSNKKRRILMIPILLILLAVPPIGILVWAHPVTGAGILFPGWGWLGLMAAILLIMAIARWPLLGVSVLLLASISWLNQDLPNPPKGWEGMNTKFKFDVGGNFYRDYLRQTELISLVKKSDAKILVFGESLGGNWDSQIRKNWMPFEKTLGNKTVLLGARFLRDDGKYDNGIIRISDEGDEVIYRQRMPVPITMWQPFSDGNATARIWRDSVLVEGDMKVAFLICYEAFLVWPILQSMTANPDILIMIANTWWTKHTTLSMSQLSITKSWTMLFKIESVTAINQ